MKRRVMTLPFPPSVNRYWRHVGPRVLISREGRSYREAVRSLLAAARPTPDTHSFRGRIDMKVTLHPPDRRRRDIDNPMKGLLDALEHAGVYADDSQIDHLTIDRGAVVPGGSCTVEIVAEH